MSTAYGILGIGPEADDGEVRRAYLRAVRAHPPDTDPEGFKQARRAYDLLSTRRKRLSYGLFSPDIPSAAEVAGMILEEREPASPDQDALLQLIEAGALAWPESTERPRPRDGGRGQEDHGDGSEQTP